MGHRPRNWQVQRQLTSTPNAWQRWDQAYQLLLHLSQTAQHSLELSPEPINPREETLDESGQLCQGVDLAASSDPNH